MPGRQQEHGPPASTDELLSDGLLPMLSLGGITPLLLRDRLDSDSLADDTPVRIWLLSETLSLSRRKPILHPDTEERDQLDSDSLTDENDFAEPEPRMMIGSPLSCSIMGVSYGVSTTTTKVLPHCCDHFCTLAMPICAWWHLLRATELRLPHQRCCMACAEASIAGSLPQGIFPPGVGCGFGHGTGIGEGAVIVMVF